jgi:hypothetical protein
VLLVHRHHLLQLHSTSQHVAAHDRQNIHRFMAAHHSTWQHIAERDTHMRSCCEPTPHGLVPMVDELLVP